ncbi:MAG: glutathione S-transferase family protein [Kiloniellaceae bacterium]
MLDLYFANSGNSLRAALALEECDLPYDRHKLNMDRNDHKAPDFLAINPLGTVPVLIERGGNGAAPIVLTQSAAIVTFAAETSGRFIPSARAARAEVMRWFMTAVTDAQPTNQLLLYLTKYVPDFSEAGKRYLEDRWLAVMGSVEAQLAAGGGDYICGDFSIADIAFFPIVRIRRPLLEAAGGFPQLLAWADRVGGRPAASRALAA